MFGLRYGLRNCWKKFDQLYAMHPMRMQVVTSGVLWVGGDYMAQHGRNIIERQSGKPITDFSWKRSLMVLGFATCVIAPLGHRWYCALDKICSIHFGFPQGSNRAVTFKVAVDTIIYTPIYTGTVLSYMTIVDLSTDKNRQTFTDDSSFLSQALLNKIQSDYIPTLLAELLIWPGYMVLVYKYLPVRYQLLAENFLNVFDSAFLCWAGSEQSWVDTATQQFVSSK